MDDGGGASAADEEGMANALDAETGAERGCEGVDAMVGMVCTGPDAGGTVAPRPSPESESHTESLDGTVGASDSFVLDCPTGCSSGSSTLAPVE